MPEKICGTLTYWFDEQGRLLWLFLEDGFEGLEHVHLLRDGDYLCVFGENDDVLFSDYIDENRECSKFALGFRVRWIQREWDSHDWARMFVRYHQEGELPLGAELSKRQTH